MSRSSRRARDIKAKWQLISSDTWDLAREAYYKHHLKTKGDGSDYIWDHVRDYGYNEYETGVLGEWACGALETIIVTERRKAISKAARRLAREAYESHGSLGTDPTEYIRKAIENTDAFTEDEKGVLGEWARGALDAIIYAKKKVAGIAKQP